MKLSTENADVELLKKIIKDFGASAVDVTSGCLIAELAASSAKIDDFLEAVADFKMLEMCRSGAIAMERGDVLYDLN